MYLYSWLCPPTGRNMSYISSICVLTAFAVFDGFRHTCSTSTSALIFVFAMPILRTSTTGVCLGKSVGAGRICAACFPQAVVLTVFDHGGLFLWGFCFHVFWWKEGVRKVWRKEGRKEESKKERKEGMKEGMKEGTTQHNKSSSSNNNNNIVNTKRHEEKHRNIEENHWTMEENSGTIEGTIEENHGKLKKTMEKSMKIMDKSMKTMENSIKKHGTNSETSGKIDEQCEW